MLGVATLWVRSYWRWDIVRYVRAQESDDLHSQAGFGFWDFESDRGLCGVTKRTVSGYILLQHRTADLGWDFSSSSPTNGQIIADAAGGAGFYVRWEEQ